MAIFTRRIPAVMAIAVMAGTAAGCSSQGGSDGAQAAVFVTSPRSDLTLTVWEGTGTVVDFGLILDNGTGASVRLLGMSLLSPSMSSIRVDGFEAYRSDESSMPFMARGVLPKICPAQYRPAPLSQVVVAAHSFNPWYVIVSMQFFRTGRYHVGIFRIRYDTAGHAGSQRYYVAITVNVVPAKSNPGYSLPDGC
jgi:hypothetical protein